MNRLERYRQPQTPTRQHLRSEGTPAEAFLWRYLKARRLSGRRFRRQYGVGPYVLDFYCPVERLAVELDGAVHDDPAARTYDDARTAVLRTEGIRVVRFENRRVFEETGGVLAEIASHFLPETLPPLSG